MHSDLMGQTPLTYAASSSLIGCRLLLDARADVMHLDCSRRTVLFGPKLGTNKHPTPQLAKLLLDRSCDANVKDLQGMTAVGYAAAHGQGDLVRQLVAARGDLHSANLVGETCLFQAARCANESKAMEMCQLLISELGADPLKKDYRGITAAGCTGVSGKVQEYLTSCEISSTTNNSKKRLRPARAPGNGNSNSNGVAGKDEARKVAAPKKAPKIPAIAVPNIAVPNIAVPKAAIATAAIVTNAKDVTLGSLQQEQPAVVSQENGNVVEEHENNKDKVADQKDAVAEDVESGETETDEEEEEETMEVDEEEYKPEEDEISERQPKAGEEEEDDDDNDDLLLPPLKARRRPYVVQFEDPKAPGLLLPRGTARYAAAMQALCRQCPWLAGWHDLQEDPPDATTFSD